MAVLVNSTYIEMRTIKELESTISRWRVANAGKDALHVNSQALDRPPYSLRRRPLSTSRTSPRLDQELSETRDTFVDVKDFGCGDEKWFDRIQYDSIPCACNFLRFEKNEFKLC